MLDFKPHPDSVSVRLLSTWCRELGTPTQELSSAVTDKGAGGPVTNES